MANSLIWMDVGFKFLILMDVRREVADLDDFIVVFIFFLYVNLR